MIRWSIASRNQIRDALPTIIREYPDLRIVRLRSRRQVKQLLEVLERSATSD